MKILIIRKQVINMRPYEKSNADGEDDPNTGRILHASQRVQKKWEGGRVMTRFGSCVKSRTRVGDLYMP